MKIKIVSLILILILFTNFTYINAADNTISTTAIRMKPLQDKLAAITSSDIEKGLSKYNDVKGHWAKEYIGKLTQIEVIGGGGKGTFNPNGEMSVAGFIKMVTISLGYKISPSTKIGTHWYDTYIAQAKKDKLIDTGDFTDYTKAITREQASKILYRAAMLFQPAPKNQGEINVMKFRIKDYAKIKDKYKDCFVKAYYIGYFTLGATGVCNPQGTFSRAQACTVVIRLLDYMERPAFQVNDGEYYIDSDDGGKEYPIGSLENVQAINFMDKAITKSTGYVDRNAGAPVGASYAFYDNKEESESNWVTGMRLTIQIFDDGSTLHNNWPCNIVIFNTKETKAKHLAALNELMKFYFEDKSGDAITQLNKVLAGSNSEYLKEYKIKDRYMLVHYVDDTSISIDITCKGGLTRTEYLKKYPN